MLTCTMTKSLRDFPLEVSLSLGQETLAIIGPSGCGKSTTLRLLSGLLKPEAGQIALADRVLFDRSAQVDVAAERREIGFVFQDYALFPHMTVAENVAYGLGARDLPKAERERRVQGILAKLEIAALADYLPDELSGGQQQRVALARALVIEPKLLLLDEPLSALDVTTRDRVRRELRRILTAFGIPAIIVTHDYEDAVVLGDRIAVMERGHVVQQGTAEELIVRPRSRFVADFSRTNFYAAGLSNNPDGRVVVQPEGHQFALVSAETAAANGTGAVIHPWQVRISREEPTGENRFQAVVASLYPLGGIVRVEVEGPLGLSAELPLPAAEQLGLQLGDSVWVQVPPEAVLLV
jgi:ABC-type Fe3+/spermidine/putrescine transport system ATPase subunit